MYIYIYIYISGRFNVVLTQFPFQICGMGSNILEIVRIAKEKNNDSWCDWKRRWWDRAQCLHHLISHLEMLHVFQKYKYKKNFSLHWTPREVCSAMWAACWVAALGRPFELLLLLFFFFGIPLLDDFILANKQDIKGSITPYKKIFGLYWMIFNPLFLINQQGCRLIQKWPHFEGRKTEPLAMYGENSVDCAHWKDEKRKKRKCNWLLRLLHYKPLLTID